jgi:hypothetical protein
MSVLTHSSLDLFILQEHSTVAPETKYHVGHTVIAMLAGLTQDRLNFQYGGQIERDELLSLRKLRKIETIYIGSETGFLRASTCSDRHLRHILERMPSLRSWDFAVEWPTTERAVLLFSANCKQLTHLVLQTELVVELFNASAAAEPFFPCLQSLRVPSFVVPHIPHA